MRYAAETESTRVWSDAVYAAAIIEYLQREWPSGSEILAQSYDLIRRDGDEPRRARINAWLGAYAAWLGKSDLAEYVIREGLSISDSLGLTAIRGDCLWALGILETEKQDAKKSFEAFDAAWEIYEKNVLRPRLFLTYLEASRSIRLPTTDPDLAKRAVDRFLYMQKVVDELLEYKELLGFLPNVSLTNFYYSWNLCMDARQMGDKEQAIQFLLDARHCLADAKRSAELVRNKGVLKVVAGEEGDLASELKALGLSE
jgi:hypothetical protein